MYKKISHADLDQISKRNLSDRNELLNMMGGQRFGFQGSKG